MAPYFLCADGDTAAVKIYSLMANDNHEIRIYFGFKVEQTTDLCAGVPRSAK